MPVNIVPVDTFAANFQAAADGDAVSQAIRVGVMQEYADALTYLRNRSIEALGGVFQVPIAPVGLYYAAAAWVQRWGWDPVNNGLVNHSVAGVDEIAIPIPPLIDTSFSDITIRVDGDAGSGGPHVGLPASMPRITLYRLDATAGTLTNVGNQVDPSAGIGAYDVIHSITYTPGAAQIIDSDTSYFLSVRGESGANSIALALVMFGCYMTIVPT